MWRRVIKTQEWARGITEDCRELTQSDARKMDGYPVLQIVRCRLGTEMEMDNQGYPFPMAAHSHSHLPHSANHAHFPRPHYPHPCGTPTDPFRLSAIPFCAPFVHSCAYLLIGAPRDACLEARSKVAAPRSFNARIVRWIFTLSKIANRFA